MKNKKGFHLPFGNIKLDPDGWLVAGQIFNCTKKIEKQDAEKKNAQSKMKLYLTEQKNIVFLQWRGVFS